jgi:hypothetical protein
VNAVWKPLCEPKPVSSAIRRVVDVNLDGLRNLGLDRYLQIQQAGYDAAS